MGNAPASVLNFVNGTRYIIYLSLNGTSFDYRQEGSNDLRTAVSVGIANGSFIQMYSIDRYTEITVECKDHIGREVKYVSFYTLNDFSWVARNFGVVRLKQGTLGLVPEENYADESSTFYQTRGGNWKFDFGEKIRFYTYDVDREFFFIDLDRESRTTVAVFKLTAMGSANSHIINVINGSRFVVYVGLNGRPFEYRKEGAGELRRSISVRITNGSYVQIYPSVKYLEMTIECKDQEDREVKYLRFYTRDDFSWIVRNFGVARQKPGLIGLLVDDEYTSDSSINFKEQRGNWKYDYGEKIRFYQWDIDKESILAQQDREDRETLEAMRDAERAYGENKNWIVLSEALHPRGMSRPNITQKRIGFEFIAACQIYTATMTNKVPLIWLVYLNVESLKKEKDLGSWRIEVIGIDNVNDNLQFERIVLASDHHVFAAIHVHRGPIFSIHRIQESFIDSMINQTEVWVADPAMDLRQQDRGNRNFRLYNDADCCKCWVPGKKKYTGE